jgi:hypothetical protein
MQQVTIFSRRSDDLQPHLRDLFIADEWLLYDYGHYGCWL